MKYQNYNEWKKQASAGKIYFGDDHKPVVKMKLANKKTMILDIQMFHDGFCQTYYGLDLNGKHLYLEGHEWKSFTELEYPMFPDFVENETSKKKSQVCS